MDFSSFGLNTKDLQLKANRTFSICYLQQSVMIAPSVQNMPRLFLIFSCFSLYFPSVSLLFSCLLTLPFVSLYPFPLFPFHYFTLRFQLSISFVPFLPLISLFLLLIFLFLLLDLLGYIPSCLIMDDLHRHAFDLSYQHLIDG